MTLDLHVLTGVRRDTAPARTPAPGWSVAEAASAAEQAAYRRLRRDVFVAEQGLFARDDLDAVDDDPRTVVLLARAADGTVLGGVRLHPAPEADGSVRVRDIGWWRGSRLVVAPGARSVGHLGPALVRAACARAEAEGALRFDAVVQVANERLFSRLGWRTRASVTAHGTPHVVMDWPIDRVQRLADATKAALGRLLDPLRAGVPAGYVGDDAAPVPSADGLVAACDAILPSMVERDPEWAGWCAVLVNVNDLAAMGAHPVGLLDAVGARDASFARRVLRGLGDAAAAWGVPVLGGHTQLGVPAALSVTALGRTDDALPRPVPGGGGRAGDVLRVTADLGGGWRPGYTGQQWDSTSHRRPDDLRAQARVVPTLAPTAAKDVSMSGLVGTTGMLAEASGCRAVLDVAAIPTPADARVGDWLTCFPGFAVVTAERPTALPGHAAALPHHVDTARCGALTPGTGVGLRWPDGVVTEAVRHTVTGMGPA
ncbi:putative N-acetyltransferase (TIGR04045 family) [Nocardioides zeae]|uniref:N-acetyltransferase (TIGR04045 family) n=1 Tax=Nocardioides zeae TaxID=1457234 RepID=A0ACC6IK77_9ACTN|nr:MSMEG_0567/sll0787 family protein [Nocardioides zeae]MDR6173696.1 putative N-acetyltransferase (TIGR04045 family) [Nocardioides zeae]MDR6211099.1 putative N-acetyltransferase (TIGR04045 family) [Nocardioides zeae]